MTRLEAFHSFKKHPFHSREFARLKNVEVKQCEAFITANDHLNRNDFAEKANRWMLDQPKPKNYSLMWGLVIQANSLSFS